MTRENIDQLLRNHSVTFEHGEKLMVLDEYTLNGEYGAEWIELEPTRTSIMRWLGY